MPDIVYVKQTCVVSLPDGTSMSLSQGDSWYASDRFVHAYPDLFSNEPTLVRGNPPAVIETATRAPGERRTVKPRG